jgi:hypothetical protein
MRQLLQGKYYVGVNPGKEPLSWHLRSVEANELAKEWLGFTNSGNPPDNYQTVLQFFKTETEVR